MDRCQVGGSQAAPTAVEVDLVIDPSPQVATVTTQVALGEAPRG